MTSLPSSSGLSEPTSGGRFASTRWTQILAAADPAHPDAQEALFAGLSFCLTGSRSELPYAALAVSLSLTEPAVRVAVHRLCKRYRQLLREEIAQTVARPEDVDDELRALRMALTG